MPPKKPPPRNAFFYFMLEFKDSKGKQFNNMRDVAEAAGPHWNKMTKEQRMPYENRAAEERNQTKVRKYTSDGYEIAEIERREQAEQAKMLEMREEIMRTMGSLMSNGSIDAEPFYIIHINTFCQSSTSGLYFPAEIAVTSFTLKNGVSVNDTYHSMIYPGALPLGYAAIAMSHSNETHQIRPPVDQRNNSAQVFKELIEFLSERSPGLNRLPIMYTHERNLKMIRQILEMWCHFFQQDENMFKVYSMQFMFRALKNTVAKENVWISDTFSTREIEKDVYAYTPNISCNYHEVTTSTYCSLSCVVRYAYIICDNCCPNLGINLIPGFHVPAAAKLPEEHRMSAAASSHSLKSGISAMGGSIRDDDTSSVMSFSSNSEFFDTESVTSDAGTIKTGDLDDNFPVLGSGRRSQPSGGVSSMSSRSYAGATNYLPNSSSRQTSSTSQSSLTNRMESLSIDLIGEIPPPTFEVVATASRGRGFSKNPSDFPVLGRGRGRFQRRQ